MSWALWGRGGALNASATVPLYVGPIHDPPQWAGYPGEEVTWVVRGGSSETRSSNNSSSSSWGGVPPPFPLLITDVDDIPAALPIADSSTTLPLPSAPYSLTLSVILTLTPVLLLQQPALCRALCLSCRRKLWQPSTRPWPR